MVTREEIRIGQIEEVYGAAKQFVAHRRTCAGEFVYAGTFLAPLRAPDDVLWVYAVKQIHVPRGEPIAGV
jgi:hypothetical protein